jgi:hypothetical protein
MSDVEDIDHGWEELSTNLLAADGWATEVGIIGAKAEEQHVGSEFSNADIGLVHEFGSADGRIPERSFIRSAIDDHEEELVGMLKKVDDAIAEKKPVNFRRAMSIIGEAAASFVRGMIRGGIPPPNAEATLERKLNLNPPKTEKARNQIRSRAAAGEVGHLGDPTPLIDTGQLINSITHVESNDS